MKNFKSVNAMRSIFGKDFEALSAKAHLRRGRLAVSLQREWRFSVVVG
jgi:hypothetical protein